LFVFGRGVIWQDASTPLATPYAASLFYPTGTALIEHHALVAKGDLLLGLSSIIDDVMGPLIDADAGLRGAQEVRYELVSINSAGVVLSRTTLPIEFNCSANGGALACSVDLVRDGDGFLVSQFGSGVRLARVAIGENGHIEVGPATKVSELQGAGVFVPQPSGSILWLHAAADPALDFTRIVADVIELPR
jgi:hypothetical protein